MLFFWPSLLIIFFSYNKKSFIASSVFSDVSNPFDRNRRVLYSFFVYFIGLFFLLSVLLELWVCLAAFFLSLIDYNSCTKELICARGCRRGWTVLSGLLLHIFHSFGGTGAEMRSGLWIGVNPLSSFLKSFNQASVFLRI